MTIYATRPYMYFLFFIIIATSFLHGEEYPYKFEGTFEQWNHKRLDLMSLFLPPKPTILQAGSYYGDQTLEFTYVWPFSKIISFEPNPHSFNILASKIAGNNQIQVYNLALSDRSGPSTFYVCYGTSGKDEIFEHASSLLQPADCMKVHYQGPRIHVECVVLDEWCKEHEVHQIDLLCLSLEGSELQVLKSSPRILSTVKCVYISTNFFPFRVGTTHYSDLKKWLELSGFRLLAHWYREGLQGDAIFVKTDYFFDKKTSEYLKYNYVNSPKYQRYFQSFFKSYYDIDDEDDSIRQVLKQGAAYEGNIGIIIDQLTRQGSLAIDVGAHIGVHTITMSRKVGPTGGVIAFEPNKKNFMELLNNLCINNCSNVISMCRAISDENKIESLNYYRIEQDDIEKYLNEYDYRKNVNSDLIETIRLDSLHLKNVSLIKIDVEFYEYFALKGAKETILKNKPAIIFECWVIEENFKNNNQKKRENFGRVISLIESYGYEIYVIYCNDFIAFPIDGGDALEKYKKNFQKLNLKELEW